MSRSEAGVMPIGRIVGSFGVRGEIKVELLTDFPDRFHDLKTVLVGPSNEPMGIERVREHKGRVLLKLEGIETPEAVAALRGSELAVPRSEAVPLPEGHYYLEDVVGCAVETDDGTRLGTVRDVLRTGSNDVLVIGPPRTERLIPVTAEAISTLDLDARRIVVEPWVLEPEL